MQKCEVADKRDDAARVLHVGFEDVGAGMGNSEGNVGSVALGPALAGTRMLLDFDVVGYRNRFGEGGVGSEVVGA